MLVPPQYCKDNESKDNEAQLDSEVGSPQLHRVAEESVPPPLSSGVTPTLADEEPEINIFGQKVTKTGPTCSHCGFKAHNVEQWYRKHKHLRPPQGALKKGLKDGPPCSCCGSTWHSPDKCYKLHPEPHPVPKKAAKSALKKK